MTNWRKFTWVILLLSVVFTVWSVIFSGCNPVTKEKVTIECFYMNPCESCQTDKELMEKISAALKDLKRDDEIELRFYNTFKSVNSERLKGYFDKYPNAGDYSLHETLLFVKGEFIPADEKMEDRLRLLFMEAEQHETEDRAETTPENPTPVPQQLLKHSTTETSGTESTVVYFYIVPCGNCEKTDAFFENLDNIFVLNQDGKTIASKLIIEKHNVGELKSMELIKKYFEAYQVPEEEQITPILFIGDVWLSGEKAIIGQLEGLLHRGAGLQTNLSLNSTEKAKADVLSGVLSKYSAAGVFAIGLVNGINPCSISMLVFFLSIIITKNVNALKIGFSFIAGKFTAYFLFGILFFKLFNTIELKNYGLINNLLKVVMLITIFVLVVLNIRDYYNLKKQDYGKITLQLPVFLRKVNHRWIEKITVVEKNDLLMPACFGLGIAVSFGEFLCVGQLYLLTIIHMFHNQGVYGLHGAIYFTLYGFALVLPLIFIVFAVHKGKEIFMLTEMVRGKMHIIKLINAVMFLLFGLIILLT